MTTFKPLLAADIEIGKIAFPVLASPKVDGIRCLIHPTLGPVTRSLLTIPNKHIREKLNDPAWRYLDGEIVTYTDGVMDGLNVIQSKVMSDDGEPDFHFLPFDSFAAPESPFVERLKAATVTPSEFVQPLAHVVIHSADEFADYHAKNLARGWEGTMARNPAGKYKFGRSTKREGILLKVKPHDDSEGTIVGFAEQQNHPGTLGSLTLRWKRTTFEVGTGFTDAERVDLWARREELVGQTVTFQHHGLAAQGRPREPVFVAVRRDLPKTAKKAPAAAMEPTVRRRTYQQEWTPLQSASFPTAVIEQRADDRGDVYVFVNGRASYESFDQACARAQMADAPIDPVPEPTFADLEAMTRPRNFRQWLDRLAAQWRENRALSRDIAYLRSQGHDEPVAAALTLRYLDRHFLADFRDFASKRRMAGISLPESKQVYVTVHLHAKNCAALTGEERAQLRRVIDDMTPEDAFTAPALALDRQEMAEQMRQIEEWRQMRPLTPGERAQFAALRG